MRRRKDTHANPSKDGLLYRAMFASTQAAEEAARITIHSALIERFVQNTPPLLTVDELIRCVEFLPLHILTLSQIATAEQLPDIRRRASLGTSKCCPHHVMGAVERFKGSFVALIEALCRELFGRGPVPIDESMLANIRKLLCVANGASKLGLTPADSVYCNKVAALSKAIVSTIEKEMGSRPPWRALSFLANKPVLISTEDIYGALNGGLRKQEPELDAARPRPDTATDSPASVSTRSPAPAVTTIAASGSGKEPGEASSAGVLAGSMDALGARLIPMKLEVDAQGCTDRAEASLGSDINTGSTTCSNSSTSPSASSDYDLGTKVLASGSSNTGAALAHGASLSTVDGDAHGFKASGGESGERNGVIKQAVRAAQASHPSRASSDAGAGAGPTTSSAESSTSSSRLMISLKQVLERLSEVASESGAVFELLQNFWHELKAALGARSSVTHQLLEMLSPNTDSSSEQSALSEASRFWNLGGSEVKLVESTCPISPADKSPDNLSNKPLAPTDWFSATAWMFAGFDPSTISGSSNIEDFVGDHPSVIGDAPSSNSTLAGVEA